MIRDDAGRMRMYLAFVVVESNGLEIHDWALVFRSSGLCRIATTVRYLGRRLCAQSNGTNLIVLGAQ
jgi:hypothetical protein